MPSKWEDWLKAAEKMEKEVLQAGNVVERIYIDPNTFPDWCRANGVGRAGPGNLHSAISGVSA